MDFIFSLGVNDGNSYAGEKTKRDEAQFVILKSIIFKGEGRTFKDAWSIDEVETVILQIELSFFLAPSKLHLTIVYSLCICGKRSRRSNAEITGQTAWPRSGYDGWSG